MQKEAHLKGAPLCHVGFSCSLCAEHCFLRDLGTTSALMENSQSLTHSQKNDSVASLLSSKHPPDTSEQPPRQMKYEGRSASASVSPNSYTRASMLILLTFRWKKGIELFSTFTACKMQQNKCIFTQEMKQSCLLSLFGDYSCLILIKEKVSSKCLFLEVHKIPKQIQSS